LSIALNERGRSFQVEVSALVHGGPRQSYNPRNKTILYGGKGRQEMADDSDSPQLKEAETGQARHVLSERICRKESSVMMTMHACSRWRTLEDNANAENLSVSN